MTKEIYKDCIGYEGIYQVSNLGNIKSLKYNNTYKENIRTPSVTKNGYLRIGFSKNNKVKNFLVHRLVAQEFIPNSESKSEVNHINGIKTDNMVENLEWVSSSENMIHAFDSELCKNGEKHHNSKLTESQVLEILNSNLSKKKLSEIYNVSDTLINKIIKRKIWNRI